MSQASRGIQAQNGGYGFHRLFAVICILFAAFCLGGAWLVSSEFFANPPSIEDVLRVLGSTKVILSLVLAGVQVPIWIWHFRTARARASRSPDLDTALRQQGRGLAAVFTVFALAIACVSYLFVRDVERSFRTERLAQQDGVARLKAQQIDKWLLQRAIDTELLAASLKAFPFDRLAADGDVRRLVSLRFAEFLAGDSERSAVSLVASDGKSLVHVGQGAAPDENTMRVALAAVGTASGKLKIVDLFLENGADRQARLGFVLPIAEGTAGTPVSAILIATVDPSRLLFPSIQTWPTTSPSSEILLIRREGNDVVYITPPRFLTSEPGPLGFRQPIARTALPPADAAMVQGDAVREGPDYRGVASLTASHHVAGVPWIVIAKTDETEVNGPLRREIAMVFLAIVAVVFVAAAAFLVLWANERATIREFRDRQEEERAALVKHFSELVQLSRDIVILRDPDGNIVDANEAAVKAYRYTAEEFRKLNIRDLSPNDNRPVLERRQAEQVHRRKDGTLFPVEITGRALDVNGKRYRQSFIRDISKRKQLEQEIARVSQVKQALQAATSVLLHATTEPEVYEPVCRVLVEVANYKLATIAIPNHDEGKTIQFLAKAGIDDGYLAQTQFTWGGDKRSQNPTGEAIATGKVTVIQNIKDNAEMAGRDEALKRGFQSCIGLPLEVAGSRIAALAIYAERPGAFGQEEVPLLSALANDISYAVSKLRERAQSRGT